MANKTIKINVSKNLADEQNMSDSGINLEIKLSKSIIAGMAEANWEHSFTLGYDQVEGVMLLYGGSQWIPFDETPSLPPPTAPLPGAQESPVEPPTEGEPLRNLISTQVSENDPDQSDDEEWLNDIAATLVPIRRPAPAPLGKLPRRHVMYRCMTKLTVIKFLTVHAHALPSEQKFRKLWLQLPRAALKPQSIRRRSTILKMSAPPPLILLRCKHCKTMLAAKPRRTTGRPRPWTDYFKLRMETSLTRVSSFRLINLWTHS